MQLKKIQKKFDVGQLGEGGVCSLGNGGPRKIYKERSVEGAATPLHGCYPLLHREAEDMCLQRAILPVSAVGSRLWR